VAPTGARLRHPDGVEIPLLLDYVGWVDGEHRWTGHGPAYAEAGSVHDGFTLCLDMLPAQTSLGVALGLDDRGRIVFLPHPSYSRGG
jgi:hypothetical protein